MDYLSQNPATGELLRRVPAWSDAELERRLAQTRAAWPAWRDASVAERCACLARAAALLRRDLATHARLITEEMGKPIREARAEIEKCASVCEFYAEGAEAMLRDQPVASDARRSCVAYQPLGAVLAVMPWNFPYWQVFRCAVPALAAGNAVLLKHAPNVPGCAAALDGLWERAGCPPGLFRWLPIGHDQAERLIPSDAIQAVTLTGSARAGRRLAALAGAALKKTVLELGGSDAFVVLEDADLPLAVAAAVASRFQNCGQSCIAAKRFILVDAVAEPFIERFRAAIAALTVGDPLHEATRVGPLARADLRDALHRQVEDSLAGGAARLLGGEPLAGPGFFYPPTLLDRVRPGLPAHDEEVFGPVAALIRVADEAEALAAANRHRLGLGGSVWSRDIARGERFARRMECGLAFVNGMVKSDPRLPFGGVKDSGYGRELGAFGLREFVNAQSVWVG